jgi:serine/threonine protein kinase
MTLKDSGGYSVILGNRLGAGGEAEIFEVASRSELVAKVYHHPSAERAAKLQAMIASAPSDPTSAQGHVSICWPTSLLFDQRKVCVGFLMHRVDFSTSVPLFSLYNPKDRQQVALAFTWEYLLRTAINIASTVDAIHTRGYVIGDLNESNLLVANTALVTLVDCDSMQVPQPGTGMFFRCPVGKPEFTAPELQGCEFARVDRSASHDNFGLAVLVFMLLMEGTHPYAGVWQSVGDPPPLEERIRRGDSPYLGSSRVRPMLAAPPFEILPPSIQGLFRHCFQNGHTNPSSRPGPREWRDCLAQAEKTLTTCNVNRRHVFSGHRQSCPWCERRTLLQGFDPFPEKAQQQPLRATQFSPLRAAGGGTAPVAPPLQPPAQPTRLPRATPAMGVQLSNQSSFNRRPLLAVAGAFVLFGVLILAFIAKRPAVGPTPIGTQTQPAPPTGINTAPASIGRSRDDEEFRVTLLRAAFPNAQIRRSTEPLLDWSPYPELPGNIRDALAGEGEYLVVGNPDQDESGYAQDVADGKRSTTRRLRWREFPFRSDQGQPVQYIGLAHYRFPDVNPAWCCRYFVRMFLFSRSATGWEEVHTGSSLIDRGRAVAGLDLVDLDGDGIPEVLFAGEGSQAGDDFIALQVYHTGQKGFEEWLEAGGVPISFNFYDGNRTLFVRNLDIAATKAAGARILFFDEIWYRRDGAALSPPQSGRVQFSHTKAQGVGGESPTVAQPQGTPEATPTGGAATTLNPEVQQVVDKWVATTKSGDVSGHLSLYDDNVDVFYTKRNISRTDLANEIAGIYKRYSDFPALNLSAVSWVPVQAGVVQVQFDKEFSANKRTGGSYFGSVHSELTLKQTNVGWRIVGERDTKVYWTKQTR